MKIRVTLKDPDGFHESVRESVGSDIKRIEGLSEEEQDALLDLRVEAVWVKLKQWVEYQEYVNLEFDTDAGTAVVVKR